MNRGVMSDEYHVMDTYTSQEQDRFVQFVCDHLPVRRQDECRVPSPSTIESPPSLLARYMCEFELENFHFRNRIQG